MINLVGYVTTKKLSDRKSHLISEVIDSNGRIRPKSLLNDFQDNNEEYVKFTKTVGEKILSVLSNVKVLLRYALLSITESIRNDPERYRSIFYNIYPSITDCYNANGQDYAAFYNYGGQTALVAIRPTISIAQAKTSSINCNHLVRYKIFCYKVHVDFTIFYFVYINRIAIL